MNRRVRRALVASAVVAALVGVPAAYANLRDTSTGPVVEDSTSSTTIRPGARAPGTPTRPPSTGPPPTSSEPPPATAAPAPPPSNPGTGGGEPTAAAARGWELVASDEFDGAGVDTGRWEIYNSAGNGGVGLRRPSAVSQSAGALSITGRGDVSGGMAWRGGRTYGRWEVRARIDHGNGYAPAILLWPSSGNWPVDGEIDITEVPLGDREESHFTLHWGADNSQTGFAVDGDFSQWHTFAVEWLPDHITFFLDGVALYTNTDPPAIPRGPMQLAIQNDVGPYSWIPGRDADTPPEVSLQVDWVRIYAA